MVCLPVLHCPKLLLLIPDTRTAPTVRSMEWMFFLFFSCCCLSCVSYLLRNTARIHGWGDCCFFSCDGSKYESIELQSCCCLVHSGIQLVYGVFVTARHCHHTSITTVPFSVPAKSGTPSVWLSSKSVYIFLFHSSALSVPICRVKKQANNNKKREVKGV